MTAKTVATETERKDGKLLAFPVLANETIYKGSTVVLDATSRFAQTNDGADITLANGDIFLGVCFETVENKGANGDENVRVMRDGVHLFDFVDTLSSADLGKDVFINNISDDGAVTTTSDTGSPQIKIGTIVEVVSTTKARVQIDNAIGNVAANGA